MPRLWEQIGLARREGPLAERSARLVKPSVAVGALREGAVHTNTLGLPAPVAAFPWVQDPLTESEGKL